MRFRRFNRWYANYRHFFWMPCPICKQYFGGHEWRGGNSSIPGREPNINRGICPDCTKACRGFTCECAGLYVCAHHRLVEIGATS